LDDIVKQAMAKWPNVPDCYGWLGLDARGNWYMRDDQAQAAGTFDSGKLQAKGSRLQHEKLIDFIGRNYAADAQGHWFFQNGPQRVYIELETTPWVWRMTEDFSISAHTGQATQFIRCMQDENGWVYLLTTLGFGLLHTQDVAYAAQAIESGKWTLESVEKSALPYLFAYVKSPQAKK
jgi:predicted dehydrogenase